MIDWDLAPEGSKEIKLTNRGKMYFSNSEGFYYHGTWKPLPCDNWKTIATRPTQTKTVADAVEHYNCEFPEGQAILGIAYSNNKICPYYAGSPIADGTNSPENYIICTRAEFEAYVKEQEGEKWTHTFNESACRVVHNEDGDCWIKFKDFPGNLVAQKQYLKPIKPTMTAQDEAALVEFMKSSHKLEVINEVRAYIREHDII